MDPKTEHATLKRKRRQSTSSSASAEYGTVCKVWRSPEPSEDDDTEWEVEKILDWRQTRDGNGILEYKVLWKGYPKEDATWELKEHLINAQDVLEGFVKTQRDMPKDLGDEPNGDVSTGGRPLAEGDERPNEDDPHIDWTLYDDDISDEEDIAEPPPSPPHTDPEVIPSTQSVYEARDAAPLNFHTYQISVLYGNFIKVLCARSRNLQAEEHCLQGIPHALNIIRNKRLQEELLADNHSVYGYALIIVVWLIVCLRIHLDERPSYETLTTHCSSLYLTSHRILSLTYKVGLADLTVAVKFLEDVLGRQGGGNAWLKHQWFYSIPREVPSKYLPPRNIIAKQYLEALDTDDIPGLADLVLDKEVQGPPTSLRRMLKTETVRRWLLGELIKMFATVNPALLRACIEGRG
ncbi:MAG: hypothetical protein M1830_005515 [Pleopsidium flavum]|nr:MAG: hypothetical protein M1830_005515 [Pleopsidium flavum]